MWVWADAATVTGNCHCRSFNLLCPLTCFGSKQGCAQCVYEWIYVHISSFSPQALYFLNHHCCLFYFAASNVSAFYKICFSFSFYFFDTYDLDPLQKAMATHSTILAWRILWTEEPGGPQFVGSQRVGHDWVTNPRNIVWHWSVLRTQLQAIFVLSGMIV